MGWTKEMQEKYPESWAKVKAALIASPKMKGKKQSDFFLKRIKEVNIGNKNGVGKRSESFKARMREVAASRDMGLRRGAVTPPEVREKQRLGNLGQKRSPETRAKIKANRARQVVPVKDTSIEVALQKELKRRGVLFRTHEPIDGIPDIFVEPNICIFADGDYWHNLPGRQKSDRAVTAILRRKGYVVHRFWESAILESPSACIEKVFPNFPLCSRLY